MKSKFKVTRRAALFAEIEVLIIRNITKDVCCIFLFEKKVMLNVFIWSSSCVKVANELLMIMLFFSLLTFNYERAAEEDKV